MSETIIMWGNLPNQQEVPTFLEKYISRLYPFLADKIDLAISTPSESVSPDLPLNIDGVMVSIRKVNSIWKIYGPELPECKIKSLIRCLESAMQTFLMSYDIV